MARIPGIDAVVAEHAGGVTVSVWVVPGASRDEIAGVHDGALRVRVTAPPEGGKANRAVVRLVARACGARRGRVLAGTTGRRKTVLVEGVTVPAAVRALGGS
jgi:uncharacterized protein